MKKNGVIQLLKRFFQRKQRVPDSEAVAARRDWKEVFSYTIGPPDDEVTKEAFRLLRERIQKEKEEKDALDKDDNEPEL